ncbi:CaiB/BaiF CoA transferase family protein [Vannielia litorea]|uniref:CaiB/BaiF CoA transferase family protein n=1 Tax=Vannielia litorea TaxID=1217970 RepID=UPI001BCF4214|nr:CoA transferase [Vannielia litorea]
MAQPLAGLRIADFSHVIAGPLATQFLCLLGAEVIKVEPPQGDAMRYYTRDPERRGMAEPFIGANAGKKSVILDLKTDEGRVAAQAIIAQSDVFVENFRPSVAERLGLGSAALLEANPGLICCSVSGFGQAGPMRDFPAIDQVIQSVSGLMTLTGSPGNEKPLRVGFPIVDTYCALLTAFAILAAVTQKRADPEGKGQVIDVSMLDATMVMMSSVIGAMLINGTPPIRSGNRGFSGAPTADTFACADGQITIGAVQQVQVERLMASLGCEALLEDDRFATPDARMQNDTALQEALSPYFAAEKSDELEAKLAAAGVPAGKVRSTVEALDLEQLQGRELFIDVPVGDGRAEILNAGFRFAHDGPGHGRGAPGLGEHTDEVLAALGLRPAAE